MSPVGGPVWGAADLPGAPAETQGRCPAGRYPMLSRHVQRLGRDQIFRWNLTQRLLWNRHAFQCMKKTEYCSWIFYPHLNPLDCPVNWSGCPKLLLPLFWNWQLPSLVQNCSIHLCTVKMKSEDDEPSLKRTRHSSDQDICCSPKDTPCTSPSDETPPSPSQDKEKNTQQPKGLIKRHWEYFCQQSKKMKVLEEEQQIFQDSKDSQEKFDFTVMSYNILSQDLLEDNSHLYKHCQHHILAWKYRFPNILADIKRFDADILCLQEVQEDQYGIEIKPSLEALGITHPLVSGQEQSPRGNRTLTIPIWPQSLGISQDCMYEEQQKQLEKEREKEEIKEEGLKNSEEILIVEKRLPTDLHHSFRLSSVYSHYLPESGVPEITTCHSRSAVTVDYIFYSATEDSENKEPGTKPVFDGGLSLLGRLSLVTEQDLWAVNGLPNETSSSDHLPLLAKFRLEE
nr:protein angel homolog 2 [Pogona vitticeps]